MKMIEGSGSGHIPLSDQKTRIQEPQKHMDPTDPDPQHWRQPEWKTVPKFEKLYFQN